MRWLNESNEFRVHSRRWWSVNVKLPANHKLPGGSHAFVQSLHQFNRALQRLTHVGHEDFAVWTSRPAEVHREIELGQRYWRMPFISPPHELVDRRMQGVEHCLKPVVVPRQITLLLEQLGRCECGLVRLRELQRWQSVLCTRGGLRGLLLPSLSKVFEKS